MEALKDLTDDPKKVNVQNTPGDYLINTSFSLEALNDLTDDPKKQHSDHARGSPNKHEPLIGSL